MKIISFLPQLFVVGVVLLLSSLNSFLYAHHVTGAEISYECIEGGPAGNFRVKLLLYRDCNSIPVCSGSCSYACTRTISVISGEAGSMGQAYGNVQLSLVSVRDVNPNPSCPSANSICTNQSCKTPGTFAYGFERYEFVGTVNLNALGIPPSVCNVRFKFEECCRNASITTGPAGTNIYIEAFINRCLSSSPCNSSPYFTGDPIVLACLNQPFLANMGAVDPDGDSLSYRFSEPLMGITSPVTFNAPYSFDRPLPYTGAANGIFPSGISCNPLNGDIACFPGGNNDLKSTMVIEVTSWKKFNGVYVPIGKVSRDFSIQMLICPPNNPPHFQTNPSAQTNTPKYDWEVAANTTLCFDIMAGDSNSVSASISDTSFLSWNQSLLPLGASFTPNYNPATRATNGPRQDSYRFCWTPDSTRARQMPYYFVVKAKDNRCPIVGELSKSFSIKVKPNINVTISKNKGSCNAWTLTGAISGYYIPSLLSTTWSLSRVPGDMQLNQNPLFYYNTLQTPLVQFQKKGMYLARLTAQYMGYTYVYYDTLHADSAINLSIPPVSTCMGSPAMLNASADTLLKPYSFKWFLQPTDTIQPINNSFNQPQFTVLPTQSRNYYLQVTDKNNCIYWDSVWVIVNPVPTLTRPQPVQVCASADTVFLSQFSTNIPGGTGIWSYRKVGAVASSTPTSILVDSLLNLPNKDTIRSFDNWIQYRYTTAAGCAQTDSAIVRVYGNPPVNAGPTLNWCENAGIYQLSPLAQKYSPSSSSNSAVQEKWIGNGIYSVINGAIQTHYFNPLTTGVVKLPGKNIQQYTFTHIYNVNNPETRISCANSDTVEFNVIPLPTIDAGNDITVCKGDAPFVIKQKSGASSSAHHSYWIPANNQIKPAMNDSVQFDPRSSSVPNPDETTMSQAYKLYYNNGSTGCLVKDSMIIHIKSKPTIGTITGNDLVTNDTLTLHYDVPPQNQKVFQWKATSGSIIGRVDSNTVKVKWQIPNNTAKGRLQAKITNQLQCSDSTEMVISRLVQQPIGLHHLPSLQSWQVYPNPNRGSFSITTQLKKQTELQFILVDLLGKQVWSSKQQLKVGVQQTDVNTTLPAGVYFLQISDGSGQVSKKLVIE